MSEGDRADRSPSRSGRSQRERLIVTFTVPGVVPSSSAIRDGLIPTAAMANIASRCVSKRSRITNAVNRTSSSKKDSTGSAWTVKMLPTFCSDFQATNPSSLKSPYTKSLPHAAPPRHPCHVARPTHRLVPSVQDSISQALRAELRSSAVRDLFPPSLSLVVPS